MNRRTIIKRRRMSHESWRISWHRKFVFTKSFARTKCLIKELRPEIGVCSGFSFVVSTF